MLRMGKKRTNRDDKKPSRSADRHRKRHMIGLRPAEHDALQELADRNHRPLLWQLRLILHDALAAEGLWPPPPPGPAAEE